ncbi:MAG: carbohydrate ABC transporter permease [Microbacterium sp.]|uniref:carbohydrate ABC transporter permease n=1 Tax=Microbacterium sp. TaxID=51671 RepID=UPI001ACDB2F9|nr:carbohydrate ABC transporter permease [Microbacterium sp.]MBN9176454.1 carbohydrate ABC transporter permease [Microbacterium sp.]
MQTATKRRSPASRLVYVFVALFLLLQLYPVFWVLASSFKTPEQLAGAAPYSLPTSLYFGNYVRAFEDSQIPLYLLNSTIVALLTIGLTIALGAPAAFAITKLGFRAGQKILGYFLFGIMVPIFVVLLPMFQAYGVLGLRDSLWAVIIPQIGFNLPLCIYLYTTFMRYIPDSLIEAARIDGAGTFRILTRIVFPLSANTTVTIITFNFVFVWNEFVFANTFLTSVSNKTLPIGLNDYVGVFGKTDFGATYAAIVVSLVPTLILYFILNRQVINGMAAGAVRG